MKPNNSGFSLIEVLVALVILVVGLIGVFNLHLVAKRGSFESFQQTQASYIAQDIINRMRLNRTELTAYSGIYTGALTSPSTSCDVASGGSVSCTLAQTRSWDIFSWEQTMTGRSEQDSSSRSIGGLDSPTACIQALATGDVDVVITWRGIRQLSDGAADHHSAFAHGCGTEGKRRRIYSVSTVII